jgi:hypothetical protein
MLCAGTVCRVAVEEHKKAQVGIAGGVRVRVRVVIYLISMDWIACNEGARGRVRAVRILIQKIMWDGTGPWMMYLLVA